MGEKEEAGETETSRAVPGQQTKETKAGLTLEYIRVFLWPFLLVLGVLYFKPVLDNILSNRNWSLGPFKVQDQVGVLGTSAQNQLIAQKDVVQQIEENVGDPAKVKDLAGQLSQMIESTQKGINNDLNNIKDSIPVSTDVAEGKAPPGGVRPDSATDFETKGFQALLAKDIDAAIAAFTQSEAKSPTYHSVAEIRRLLVKNQQALKDKNSPQWKVIYQTVLTDYSWGMPSEVRSKLRAS